MPEKGSKRQMCPGNRGQGRNYPQTAGDRESAVQAKPGEVRAWQGLSPAVGDRAEIPAQGRNPYKEQKPLQRAEIPAQSRNSCTEQKSLHRTETPTLMGLSLARTDSGGREPVLRW